MKRIYRNATLQVAEGTKGDTQAIQGINSGKLAGFSTHLIGTRPAKAVRIVLSDNGTDIGDPIDIAFTETENRASFESGVIKIGRENIGNLEARIVMDEAVEANEDFKVEVLAIIDQQSAVINNGGGSANCNY